MEGVVTPGPGERQIAAAEAAAAGAAAAAAVATQVQNKAFGTKLGIHDGAALVCPQACR